MNNIITSFKKPNQTNHNQKTPAKPTTANKKQTNQPPKTQQQTLQPVHKDELYSRTRMTLTGIFLNRLHVFKKTT